MLVLTELEPDKIEQSLASDHFFWLDLERPTPDVIRRAADMLELHPVAVEDTLEFGQRPKVDIYDRHLLIVYFSSRVNGEGTTTSIEVHVYLSGGFVVTVRRDRCTALEDLHAQLEQTPVHDEGYLVYRILDTLTDAYYPVIDDIEKRVDALEADVLLDARREQLPVLYRLRQDVRELLRVTSAQRDHYMQTAEAIRALPGLEQGTREYLRDVGDHITQVAGELQRQTDDLNALTGTYFNANADRLNAVATRLTIVGTLFIVTTLVTGFFGQNFGWLVHNISSRTDFLIFGVGGVVVPVGLAGAVLWLKRDDWF